MNSFNSDFQTNSLTPAHPHRVKVLPPQVADCIAAGEVIERPASVVKELVENALDAGATEIQVTLEGGGKQLIEVLDNGTGIHPEDLALCVSRHATSKLRSLDDLDHLYTLGFRGEALPSIVAVSEVSLVSSVKTNPDSDLPTSSASDKKSSASSAWEWRSDHQRTEKVTFGNFLGSPHGSRIRCRGLFQNLPARLKFLKSDASEISHIREWLERLSLTHPKTGFKLIHDTKTMLQLRPKTLPDRMKEILHSSAGAPIIEWKNEIGPVRLEILWAQGMSLANSRKIFQIVNGRCIKDKLIQTAIMAGFKQSLLPGNYPALILSVEINPRFLDVNVHPTKTEVRFLHSGAIFQAIESTLSEMIRQNGMIPSLMGSSFSKLSSSSETRGSLAEDLAEANQPASPAHFSGASALAGSTSGFLSAFYRPFDKQYYGGSSWSTPTGPSPENGNPLFHGDSNPLAFLPLSRFRSCLFDTYLVFELNSDELLFIDQHAAHERVRFEKLKNRFLRRLDSPQSQSLLIPEVVEFESEQADGSSPLITFLQQFGFDCEIFGEGKILFRATPVEWGTENLKSRLRALVDRYFELNSDPALNKVEKDLLWDERAFEKLAMESCRSSIRAGDTLSNIQVQALIEQLRECEHPWNCPHGRPAMIRISREKLEEWFQRKI